MNIGTKQVTVIEGRRLRLTNPNKVMYPVSGTTKAEVIEYYVQVAPHLLPHLRDRPVTRKRWVDGVDGEMFFEKNLPSSAPDWLPRVRLSHREGRSTYPLFESAAALAWAGQVNALELHVPQWRCSAGGVPEPPDRLVLDLDPGPGVGLAECVRVARLAREYLADVGLTLLPVTSGSKGLHLYSRLDGRYEPDYVSGFARQLAEALERERPELVVSSMSKAARAGKVLVDWSQNNGAKTTISPYSLRGAPTPMVAAPRAWEELDGPADELLQLTLDQVLERVDQDGDLLRSLAPADGPVRARESIVIRDQPALRQRSGAPTEAFVEPMLVATDPAPLERHRERWSFEMKWDGIRVIATVGGEVRLYTRNRRDITAEHPGVVAALASVPPGTVLDGELVALDARGVPDFGLLQSGAVAATLLVFDALRVAGADLMHLPLSHRREKLAGLGLDGPMARVPPVLAGLTLEESLQLSREHGLEGVVAKRVDGTYTPGRRSATWVKAKHETTQAVVIGGWRPGYAAGLGSLLIGIPEPDGMLRYVGRVGSGFSDAERTDLRRELASQETAASPFAEVPPDVAEDARWVEPLRVAEVTYRGRTSTGLLRHASWRGLRKDQSPQDVQPE